MEAIKQHGAETQFRMLQEECAEVIQAVNHFMRGKDVDGEKLLKEIADVMLMIEQMKLVFGVKRVMEKFEEVALAKKKRLDSKTFQYKRNDAVLSNFFASKPKKGESSSE